MFKSVLNQGRQLSNYFSQVLCKNCLNLKQPAYRYYGKNTLEEQLRNARKKRIRSTLYYVSAAGVVTVGLSYAAVPLYRMFCQAYSYGGTTAQGHDSSKVEAMKANTSREIKVRFNADRGSNMRWNFKPQQTLITVSQYFIHQFEG